MKQKIGDYESDVENLSSSSWDTYNDDNDERKATNFSPKFGSNVSTSSSWSTISQNSKSRAKHFSSNKTNFDTNEHLFSEKKIYKHFPKKEISQSLISEIQSQSSINSSKSSNHSLVYIDDSTLDFQEVPVSLDLSQKNLKELPLFKSIISSQDIFNEAKNQSHEAFVQYLRQQCEIVVQKYLSGQNQCQNQYNKSDDIPNSIHSEEQNIPMKVSKHESKIFKARFQSKKDGLNSRIRWYSDTFIVKRKSRNHHERVTKQTSEETLQDNLSPARVYSDFDFQSANSSRKNTIKHEINKCNIGNIVQEVISQIKVEKNNAKNLSHSGDSNITKIPYVPINSNLKPDDELLNDETYQHCVKELTEKQYKMMNKILEKWQSVAPVVEKSGEVNEESTDEQKEKTEKSEELLEEIEKNKNEIDIPKLDLQFLSDSNLMEVSSSYSSYDVSPNEQMQESKRENGAVEEMKIVKEKEAAVEKQDERANDVITFETSDKGNEDSTLLTQPNSNATLEQLSSKNPDAVANNIIEELRASNNLLQEAISEQQAIRQAEGKAYTNILEQVAKNLIPSPDKLSNNLTSVQNKNKLLEKNVTFMESDKNVLIRPKSQPNVVVFKDSSSSSSSPPKPLSHVGKEFNSKSNIHKNEPDFLPQWLISEALYEHNNVTNQSKINESNDTKTSATSIDSCGSNYQLMSYKIQTILEDAARKIEKLENDKIVSETQHQKEIEWHKNNYKEMETYFKQQIVTVSNISKALNGNPEQLNDDAVSCQSPSKFNKSNPKLKPKNNYTYRGLKNEISQLKKRMTNLQRHYLEMKKENDAFREATQNMQKNKNDGEKATIDWFEKSVKRICEKEENEAVKVNTNKLQTLQDQVRNSTHQIINQNKTIKELKTKVNEYENTIANLKCRLSRSESVCHHKQLLLENMKSKLAEKIEKVDKSRKCGRPFIVDTKKHEETIQVYKDREDFLNGELKKIQLECERLNSELKRKENYIDTQMEKTMTQLMEEKRTEFINMLEDYKSQIQAEQKKSEKIVSRLKQYDNGLEEFLWLLDEETCQKLWKNDSVKKAHQMACSVLRLTPQELNSLFKEVYSKELGSGTAFEKWLQEYRSFISKENFSSHLAKFLFDVCITTMKKNEAKNEK